MNTDVAIIGNGCATLSAIEALRSKGFQGRIDVFSDSVWQPYNPMLTTYYLSGKMPFEHFFPEGKYTKFYEEKEVSVHLGAKITAMDAKKRTLTDRNGNSVCYKSCIIASGAGPFVPPISGHDGENVFVVRTLEDILKIKDFMRRKTVKRALVVGASMVGIKVAEFFSHEGIACCLADGAQHIFPLAAHPNCSAIIEKIVEENGVALRLGGAISAIEHSLFGSKAYFTDSAQPVEADLIIMAIGVRPNLGFVSPQEIAIDKGIIVNTKMQTSAQNVYAAGDCTAGNDVVTGTHKIIGLLANARCQGRTAGSNIAGTSMEYQGSTPHNITYFMNTDFVGIGDIGAEGEVYERYDVSKREYVRIVRQGEKIGLINLINLKELSGVLKTLFLKRIGSEAPEKFQGYSYEKYVETLVEKRI